MAIPNPNPVHVPPRDEKTYPHIWLTNVRIKAPTQTEGQIMIDYLPYDGTIQEIYHKGDSTRVVVPNLWEAVTEVPEAAIAMQAIFNAVAPILAWQEAKRNGQPWPPAEEDPSETESEEEPEESSEPEEDPSETESETESEEP